MSEADAAGILGAATTGVDAVGNVGAVAGIVARRGCGGSGTASSPQAWPQPPGWAGAGAAIGAGTMGAVGATGLAAGIAARERAGAGAGPDSSPQACPHPPG
ncbi:hypothetical protein A6A05_06870 [Magnetospirillum moscoviense]|uniref:Uncharacterized protein n=1 Tax=Magnetospirillum moscoviense TaxID=1437059 RepID=A0A178MZ16_9PROT|nr:hypothetical protein A6A05_06870 [Magnetospirillum moscoviense]